MTNVSAVRLTQLLESAESDLQSAAQGASLCKVSATGTTAQSIKYFEGRWAALREVQRGADARDVLDRWEHEYRAHQQRGSGVMWLHYSAGGVDALTELVQ